MPKLLAFPSVHADGHAREDDLSAADHVDTTGLSVLWESAKRCRLEDRELAIVCSGGRVRCALANTGLDEFLATHPTLDEALGRGGPAQ